MEKQLIPIEKISKEDKRFGKYRNKWLYKTVILDIRGRENGVGYVVPIIQHSLLGKFLKTRRVRETISWCQHVFYYHPKYWLRYRRYEWRRRKWLQSEMHREHSDISNPFFRTIGKVI